MKTLIIAILFSTVIGQASAQTAASWDLNEGTAATATAAGIGTGGVTYTNTYYQFAMVAASGYSLDLNSVTITARHSGSLNWSLRSSLDGYTKDLTTGTLTGSSEVITAALPVEFRSVTGIVRFRIYVNGQEMATGVNNRPIHSISVAGEAVTGMLATR